MIKIISRYITKKVIKNERNKNSDLAYDKELLNHYRSFSEEKLRITKVNYQAAIELYKNNQYIGIIFSFIFSVATILMKSAVDSDKFTWLPFFLLYCVPLFGALLFFINVSFKLLIKNMLLGLVEIALEEKITKKLNNLKLRK
ncbi:hypothetical protein AK95_16320 [Paenibacillus sp. LC231]|uniref:hypothetical protein n=1 Tax=Paenibacillus sp. LC231 TaxID=1120679 RepID=UPI0008DE476C|nr:hypothetical protein [Paenibacillus sp. LC231]OIA98725.1 hypothetical protein AK95_16320 [Paenibacillus sp. LC231]